MGWKLLRQRYAAVFVLLAAAAAAAAATSQSYQQACHESAGSPQFCKTMLSSFGLEGKDVGVGTLGRFELVSSALKSALDGVNEEIQMSEKLRNKASMVKSHGIIGKERKYQALDDCVEMLMEASELIGDALNRMNKLSNSSSTNADDDVETWISSALTYQSTCLDGLSQVPPNKDAAMQLRQEGEKVGKRISTALAFMATLRKFRISTSSEEQQQQQPKALTAAVSAWNVIVAQDGSGNYKSIQEAVAAAPSKSDTRHVIYIKAGTYKEKVSVPKSKTKLMFVGDGIGKTIITGSRSVMDGETTFRTATVEINGRGFLGRDLTIQNTAGAAKHQAVALRVSADKVAFYKCSFEGYQDTLYTHVSRQFYRECFITGTVDFIFGNAAALFQSCSIFARLPLDKQKNTLTAQGRTDPNQNTALAFQDCTLDGSANLKMSGTSTYLGRPWKKYSRTVFLRCYEGSLIHPAGWLEWSGDFALKTLFYAEYRCKGPGAAAGNRVSWSKQLDSESEASKFTAGSLISGSDWLGETNFPYSLTL